ncbi:hypothetical protein FPZ12_001450 [Amycolatopsis acidicola]|uniref:Uncharacterized protein n=1 Tax=Amycolatopsis acidicola TaxID=2596893 RepID=A0A5N0VL25_9PSEU|nr:hypothetical protein [Amycolatopsis acidicola]KAA9166886.1 hypothetical protein FPZ12_001450 [Amycolatopsis acidicola]
MPETSTSCALCGGTGADGWFVEPVFDHETGLISSRVVDCDACRDRGVPVTPLRQNRRRGVEKKRTPARRRTRLVEAWLRGKSRGTRISA